MAAKPLKLFKAEHDGKWVFGCSVILAATRSQAMKMMRTELKNMKVCVPSVDVDDIELTEISMLVPAVHVLFDGIY